MRRNDWQVKARMTWGKKWHTVRLDLSDEQQHRLAEEIGIADILRHVAGMTIRVGQFLKVRGGKERRYLKNRSQGAAHAYR